MGAKLREGWRRRRDAVRSDDTDGDAGFTLVEVLVAVVILSVVVVTLVSAIATNVTVADAHRKQATADTVVRDYAEALALVVSQSKGPDWCADSYSVPTDVYSPPSGYGVSVSVGACPAAADPQYQTATITASSSDARATESVTIVVRPTCLEASC